MTKLIISLAIGFSANFASANSVADEIGGQWTYLGDTCENTSKPNDRWSTLNLKSRTITYKDNGFLNFYSFSTDKKCRVFITGKYEVNGKEITETVTAVYGEEAEKNCGIRTDVEIGKPVVSTYRLKGKRLAIHRPYEGQAVCNKDGALVEQFIAD